MPQLRQMPNGHTRIRFHLPEDRQVRAVIEKLRYVAAKRDPDDLLTAPAGEVADRLEELADALVKPKRQKREKSTTS